MSKKMRLMTILTIMSKIEVIVITPWGKEGRVGSGQGEDAQR